jgi:hypothetical protein
MTLREIMALVFACHTDASSEPTPQNVYDISTRKLAAPSLRAVSEEVEEKKPAHRIVVCYPLADAHDALNELVALESHEDGEAPAPVRLSAAIEGNTLTAVYIFVAPDKTKLLRRLRCEYPSLEFK